MLREDLRRLDVLSEQVKLLNRYKIDTTEQLANTGADIEKRIERLCTERQTLNNEKRRDGISEECTAEIAERVAEIGILLKPLRREKWVCGQIAERAAVLQAMREQIRQRKKGRINHVISLSKIDTQTPNVRFSTRS